MVDTHRRARPSAPETGVTRRLFVDRQIYVYTDGKVQTLVLKARTQAQMAFSALAIGTVLFLGGSFAVGSTLAQLNTRQTDVTQVAAKAAQPSTMVARAPSAASQAGQAVQDLVRTVERRDAALNLLLKKLDPAAAKTSSAAPLSAEPSPVKRLDAARRDQEQLIGRASTLIRGRLARLEQVFKVAHLNPAAVEGPTSRASRAAKESTMGEGGPFIDAKDPHALAHFLDVDEPFAADISHVALDATALHSLSQALSKVPIGIPVAHLDKTSSFGFRTDPFTGRLAFHPGQDFRGAYRTPIHVTASGVVAFTGQRTGYGNTVEVDHGHGLRTRYAHLAAIMVRPGQTVTVGQQIGAMGSTGRSTGVHLHYEVWQDGRLQDPTRFLKAGQGVQQGG